MTNISEKILVDAGLSSEQALIYTYLLNTGVSNAKVISSKTGIGRTLTYKVIDQLIAMELVEKRDATNKIAMFFPKHPQKLKDLIDKKNSEARIASENLAYIFTDLSSSYNLLLGKPNVQFYEGEQGLKNVYNDILEIGEDIMVISSPIEEGRQNVLHLIREQIEKQVAKNIKTKAITPLGGQKIATQITDDEKFLISRKEIPKEKLHIPAQIIVYGDKVAITNFKESMITVVMESKYINETFRRIFDYIWNH